MKINEKLLNEAIFNHFTNGDIINLATDVLSRISFEEILFEDLDFIIRDEIDNTIYWTDDQWALIAYYFDPNEGATLSDAFCEFAEELVQVIQDAVLETEEFEEIEEDK